jgi:hypothetical protein
MQPPSPSDQDQLSPERRACRERTLVEDINIRMALPRQRVHEDDVQIHDRLSVGEEPW